MSERKLKPIAVVVGAAFAAAVATAAVAETESDLFAADQLDQVYDRLADEHGDDKDDKEGSCGEGQCGEGECGEGSCGDDKEGDDEEAA